LDATSETDVVSLFAYAGRIGPSGPALVVFNVGINADMPILDVSAELFAHFWRTNCLAGFLVGREAARSMLPWGEGTIMFTGASASMRGAACFGHAAAAKAGLRMVSQSMAREFGPLGLHVAHVVIDGAMDGERVREAFPGKAEMRGPEGLLDVEAVAETYLQLHLQDRSAWTHELDLRPFTEDW
jgi:NAD(P)-dependent dehydrogenase (short-subunit alcohol dehydrogenase family)